MLCPYAKTGICLFQMGLQVSILPDSPKTLAKPDTATNSGALWSALAMLYNIN